MPYLVGVMNAFNDPTIEEIYMCSSAQVGKTEVLLNILGYIIMQDPAPVLMVYPTKEDGDTISKNRIMPFILASKEFRERYNFNLSEKRELQFDGMYIAIVGSNSPHALASKPIKVVLLDEIDKFPGATAKEADPISLARERTATYPSYKLYMGCTPTDRGGPIWKALQGADAERHYFVPCPHCGQMIELKFAQLRWPGKEEGLTPQERADQAAYVCQECGAMIYDRDRPGMLEAGEWCDVERRAPVVKRVGFWINRMYSPFTSFSEIAREFMRCHKDPEQLHNFTNSWLGEPWEDTNLSTSADLVMERQTDVPEFVVPDWAVFLTAGVDVQRASLYWTIRAWGPYFTSQNIAHGQVLGWSDIERIMCREYSRQDGTRLMTVGRMICAVPSRYVYDTNLP